MKKLISLLFMMALCLTLFACSQEPAQQEEIQQEVQEEISEEVIEEDVTEEEIVEEVTPDPVPEFPFSAMDDVTFQENVREVAVVINLTVNPELEIFVNDDGAIIGVSCMNEDAKAVFGSEFFAVDETYASGVVKILEALENSGYINAQSEVHIAVNDINSADAEKFVVLTDEAVNNYIQSSGNVIKYGVGYNPKQEPTPPPHTPTGGRVEVTSDDFCTSTVTYNDDGSKDVVTEFNNGYSSVAEYDANGQELSKEEYDPNGNLTAKHTYDPNTNTIIREEYYPDGTLANTHILGPDGAVIGKG